MPNTLEGLPPDVQPELRRRLPELPWDHVRETHGAFHHVLLLPPSAALRVRTGPGHEAAIRREHDTAAALSAADLPVARPLLDPVHTAEWSVMVAELVDGHSREPRTWSEDRIGVLTMLESWAAAVTEHPELAVSLPSARAWCGGDLWPMLVEEMTAADPEVQEGARARMDTVLEFEASAERSAVHGDLGMHNILWKRDGAAVLIDTDHAAWADRAIDIAPLLSAYGRDALAADLPGEVLNRAAAHRRVLSLQVAAAAELRGDGKLRDHALANFARRIRSGDPQW